MPQGKKHTCFVCGYRTLDNRCDWDICPICFWEDDVFLEVDDDDESSPANKMMVSQAQANFIRYGAVSPDLVNKVRPPLENAEKDPDWKLLQKTLEILKKELQGQTQGKVGVR